MRQIKQTLSEELNRMKYMLGYQRGTVISEQDNQKLSIRQTIERDITNEKLGLTWAQVKQSFGSTGQSVENQMLYKAWVGGWRPGKTVPDQFQTQTYKQNNQNTTTTTTVDAATTITTTQTTSVAGEQSKELIGRSKEEVEQKIESLKQQVKDARQQRKLDKRQCKEIAKAIDKKSINPFKIPVADQEICDTLRFCITQGLIEDTRFTDWSACDAFPATTTTTTVAAATTTTTTIGMMINKPVQG